MMACNGETETVESEVVTDDVAVADTWDEEAYYTTFTNTTYYEDWDLNDDGLLSEEEFRTSFYETFDTDNDGRISQSEWTSAVSDFGVNAADWTAWDTDGDGFIDMAEFTTSFSQVGWYDTWDLDDDAMITEREYTAGVFRIWDENDNNVLDETENVHYNTYYGV